jgi:branched-chain amino acid transport system substrate-binding protein
VIHDNQDYSKGLADAVSAALGDAAGPFIINPEETDYSSVVQQVANADPDLVFYGGYSAQAGPLVQQLREGGVEATFISDDGTKDSAFGELAGDAAEGVQVTCPCVDPLGIPEAEAFVAGINETYDRNPGTFAADSYDATNLVAEALLEVDADSDIEEIRTSVVEYLRDADYQGVAKSYSFLETGNLDIGPEGIYVYEWSDEDEDFVSLGPANELIE